MMSKVEVVATERVSNPTRHAYERRPIDVFAKRSAGRGRHDRVARQSSSCDALGECSPRSERKHKNEQCGLHASFVTFSSRSVNASEQAPLVAQLLRHHRLLADEFLELARGGWTVAGEVVVGESPDHLDALGERPQ